MLEHPVEVSFIGNLGRGVSSVSSLFLHLKEGQCFCPPNCPPSNCALTEDTQMERVRISRMVIMLLKVAFA